MPALKDVELFLDERMLTQPLRWTRPRRIFVCSMTDLFMEQVPDEWIDRMFAVMALARWHTFLVLTKRERMASYCGALTFERVRTWMNRAADGGEHRPGALNLTTISRPTRRKVEDDRDFFRPGSGPPFPNVWLGVSAEDQQRADERIPWLLKTPAAVRWVSYEPALGLIDFTRVRGNIGEAVDLVIDSLAGKYVPAWRGRETIPDTKMDTRLDWIVVGGESGGPPERTLVRRVGLYGWLPTDEALEWVRSIRDQCVAAGVSFFHKQWGGPTAKSGGRLLDGRTWEEYPKQADRMGRAVSFLAGRCHDEAVR